MTRRAAVLIGVLTMIALIAPWAAPYDPEHAHREFLFAPPMPPRIVHDGGLRAPFVFPIALADRLSQRYEEDRARTQSLPWFDADAAVAPAFLLGADSFGRDVLSRLLYGARTSIGLALTATFVTLLIGGVVGGAAGYRGGWADDALMRVADFVLVLPTIYVVLVLRALLPLVLTASQVFVMTTAIFAMVGWPYVARGVRGVIAGERHREYALAAQALGASGWRVFARHLLPAAAGYLLVQATLLMPSFILAEATLSYVGLGFPEHVPTWGTMLVEAANVSVMTRFPWVLAPAAAIFLVVLITNVLLQGQERGRWGG